MMNGYVPNVRLIGAIATEIEHRNFMLLRPSSIPRFCLAQRS